MQSCLETRVWSSSGKALGFGLLLFDMRVLEVGPTAFCILFGEDIAVKGEAHSVPSRSCGRVKTV